MANNLRQHRNIIYRLKRMWGFSAEIKRPVADSYDIDTGDITRSFTTVVVNRAILLPKVLDRSFDYDLTFIASNNNFVRGGNFDRNLRTMIIDAKDLTAGFVPVIDDHVEVDGLRYKIKSVEQAERKVGYILGLIALSTTDLAS